MNKVITAIFLVFIVQTTAMANNWIRILENNGKVYSIKSESLRWEDGLMYVWTQITKKDAPAKEKVYLAFNCSNRTFKSLDEYDYSDDDFDNQDKNLDNNFNSLNKFSRVLVNSPVEKVYRYVCK